MAQDMSTIYSGGQGRRVSSHGLPGLQSKVSRKGWGTEADSGSDMDIDRFRYRY